MTVTAGDPAPGGHPDSRRDETQLQRLDRNTIEFMQEVRVAAVGIQVLFAFLLVLPFSAGWKDVTGFDRYDYFVTLICIATASVLLIAPSIHHRLLFRRQQKEFVIELGNKLVIIAAGFLVIGFTGIMVLISGLIFSATTADVVGACVAVAVIVLWFGIPWYRIHKSR